MGIVTNASTSGIANRLPYDIRMRFWNKGYNLHYFHEFSWL